MEASGKKVVLIMAPGHSGSTLLDMILSSGINSFGIGEIYAVRKEKYRNRQVPLCSIDGFECEFWNKQRWSKVESLLYHTRIKKVFFSLINYKYRLYNYLIGESGKNMLVDSSKYPEWVSHSIKSIEKTDIQPYLIFLSRDARAIVNSWMRKYPEKPISSMVSEHKSNLVKMNKIYDDVKTPKIKVAYEDITSNTEEEFARIFNFLGEEFCSEYLEYWKYEHHHVGGNSGTKSLVKKYQGNTVDPGLNKFNSQYYNTHKLAISKDERWRSELSDEHRIFIEQAFNLNEN